MKSCKEINELIPLYVDGELDEEQRTRLEEHIKGCQACRDELEGIMHIINLCKDVPEEELPENFRGELHDKLVKEKEKQKRTSKVAHLRNRYIKILSAIAAGLLIMVLLKGFINNSVFMPGSFEQNKSTESKAAMESAKAADKAESADIKAAYIKPQEEKAEVQSNADAKAGIMAEPAQTPKTDASRFLPDQRVDNGTGANKDAKIVSSRNARITLGTVNPGVQPEKVRELALSCGAEFDGDVVYAAAIQENVEKDKSVPVMHFKVPNSRYEEFVNLLTASFGKYGVEVGPLDVQDMAQVVNDLNNRLVELENSIDTAEKNNKNVSSPEELNRLKADRENIMAEIERIHLDSDYTFVTITIKEN